MTELLMTGFCTTAQGFSPGKREQKSQLKKQKNKQAPCRQ
jgi:hypothetical protein